MFCKNCGMQLPDGPTYCARCGTYSPGNNEKAAEKTSAVVEAVSQAGKTLAYRIASTEHTARQKWLASGGNALVSKEKMFIDIITRVSVILLVFFYLWFIDCATKREIEEGSKVAAYIVVGCLTVLAVFFGILSMKQPRTGYAIAFTVFGVIATAFTSSSFASEGVATAITLIFWIVLDCGIYMQTRITNIYRSNAGSQ